MDLCVLEGPSVVRFPTFCSSHYEVHLMKRFELFVSLPSNKIRKLQGRVQTPLNVNDTVKESILF